MIVEMFNAPRYNISTEGDYIIVSNKRMLVKDAPGYIYKLRTTYVGHSGIENTTCPAESLKIILNKWIAIGNADLEKRWAQIVIKHILTYGKKYEPLTTNSIPHSCIHARLS